METWQARSTTRCAGFIANPWVQQLQAEEKWAACYRCDKWRLLEPSVDIDALPQVR